VLELFTRGQQIDREQIEADGDTLAVLARELTEPGLGHHAELALLVFVDGGICGGEITGCAGFDFEDDERGAIPGDKVEVAAEFGARPPLGDDGEAEAAEVEERGLFTAETGDQVGREFRCGGTALEEFERTLLEIEAERGETHFVQRAPKASAAKKTVASSVPSTACQFEKADSARKRTARVAALEKVAPVS
jgi:hypothetical protein